MRPNSLVKWEYYNKGVRNMSVEIGAKIKQFRTRRSMTQEQLGLELGVSAQAVSKWESGVSQT